MQSVRLTFRRRPAAWRYMVTAFYPTPRFGPGVSFPEISARWSGHRPGARERADVYRLCGIDAVGAQLPLIFPHVIGFRLQMALLTHPRFPLPIWGMLQVRNHLLQHRPLQSDAILDFETHVAAHRVLEKGLEVDLHTSVYAHAEIAWESVNTFYTRGRFGPPEAASPMAQAPSVGNDVVATWRMLAEENIRFAWLTGDYNGIHLSDRYARWLGFERALFHPQRVLGHCLSRLGIRQDADGTRLDVWLKGPVYYDSTVVLRADRYASGATFAFHAGEESRPSIVGHVERAREGVSLPEALGRR